jgi:hypothetical protein
MRWFRTHIGLGSRLALFALAVQLVLSFGHVHVGKIAPASSHGAMALVQAPDHGPSPKPHTGADDYCAICATVSLLASSVPPAAVSLVLPVARPSARPQEIAISFVPFDSSLIFQARGPPARA